MGLTLTYQEGQTPIDEEEKEGLLIRTIATRAELNEFEQQNIERAVQWSIARKVKQQELFSEKFICEIHRRMYGDVWAWAGEFRKTNKNLGVDRWQIPVELKALLDDACYWVENKIYPPDDLAIRLKHRIVSIHCFPNGNGRHSRLLADMVIDKLYKRPVFSWGAANLSKEGEARANYLKAIKAADQGEYESLIIFARS